MIKKTFAIMLLLLMAYSANMNGQDFNGFWGGEMAVGPRTMKIEFNIKQTADGVSITWGSPDEGVFDMPATATISGNELNVAMARVGASYKGVLNGEVIEGAFSQNGMNFPLNLTQK